MEGALLLQLKCVCVARYFGESGQTDCARLYNTPKGLPYIVASQSVCQRVLKVGKAGRERQNFRYR